MKIILSFLLFLTLFISPTFSQTRDEMEDLFREEAIEIGYENVEEQVQMSLDSYDWILENATDKELLNSVSRKWGDKNYFMMHHEYERQVDSYNWLIENKHITGEADWDNNYYEMQLLKERDISTRSGNISMVFAFLGVLAFLSLIQFLIYLKDMFSREEKIFFWGFIFLISGPIGLSFYLSYRKLKDGEKREGRRLYHLSKNFILPWTIYVLGGFILIFSLTIILFLLIDSNISGISSTEHILEFFFWIGLILVVFVIPIQVFIPVILSTVIMFLTKEKKVSKN